MPKVHAALIVNFIIFRILLYFKSSLTQRDSATKK